MAFSPLIEAPEQTIALRVVYNPFDPSNAEKHDLVLDPGKPLSHYLTGLPYSDTWLIGFNGQPVEKERLDLIVPRIGDMITLIHTPEGDDAKDIIRLAALIALAVYAPQVAAMLGQTGVIGSAITIGTIIGGTLLINALLPPPSLKDNISSSDTSTTYGVDGAKNTAKPGSVVPVIYGTHRFGGNIVDLYTQNYGDTQFLYMRTVLNDGLVSAIDDIEINGQPIANFTDIDTRVSLGEDPAVDNDWFVDAVRLNNVGVEVVPTPYVYTTLSDIDRLRLDFLAPRGIVEFDNQGKQKSRSVTLTLEYREVGDTTWLPIPTSRWDEFEVYPPITGVPASPANSSKLRVYAQGSPLLFSEQAVEYEMTAQYRAVGDTEWITIRTESAVETKRRQPIFNYALTDETGVDLTYLQRVFEVNVDAGRYEVRVLNGEILSAQGFHPHGEISSYVISGSSTKAQRHTVESATLPRGRYEVRVARTTAASTESTIVDNVYLSDVGEVDNSNINYNGTATLAVKVKLGEQLNGIPQVTALVEGSILKEYDEVGELTYERYSANPAWIALDILSNEFRGAALPTSRFDWPSWVEWAEFCEAEGLEFNAVFDTKTNVWDALQSVFRIGRAQPIRIGNKYGVVIDRAAAPVMEFNSSNILKDTLSVSWMSISERANEIELTYYDRNDSFKAKTIRLTDDTIALPGETRRVSSFSQPGITKIEQAAAEAELQLRRNKLLRKTVQFDAPLEAIGVQFGDVVTFHHESADYGGGSAGRLESGSTTTNLKLDRDVTLETGVDYKALVYQEAFSRYSVTIQSISGSNVYISGLPSGEIDKVDRIRQGTVDLRIINIHEESPYDRLVVEDATGLATGAAALWTTHVVEERDITTGAGTVSEVTLETALTVAPVQHAKWIIGRTETVKQLFRVISISGDDLHRRTIALINYSDALYEPPGVTIPEPLLIPTRNPDQVTDLTLDYAQNAVGTTQRHLVDIAWNTPDLTNYGGADIYVDENDTGFRRIGTVQDVLRYRYELLAGYEYKFRVVGFNNEGRRAPASQAPMIRTSVSAVDLEVPDITVTSEIVEGATSVRPALVIAWTAPTDARVTKIRVEVKPSAGGPTSVTERDGDLSGDNVLLITEGISESTGYTVRARFESTEFRSAWCTDETVTSADSYLVPQAGEAIEAAPGGGLETSITDIQVEQAAQQTQIDDLYVVYGDTESAALYAAAAAASADAANTAETNAEAAQAAAEAAQAAADIILSDTEAQKLLAIAAKDAAELAAGDAASSETAASGYATTASTAATNASTANTNAQAAKTAAETAQTNATTQATNAADSATAASGSATSASGFATNASNSATAADGSATSAASSATAAASSASAASGSATAAASSASAASTSATNASNSASAASTSAVSAQSVANRLLPDRPATGADFSNSSTGSGTPTTLTAASSGSVQTVTGEGDVRQYTGNIFVITRGWLPVGTGRTFSNTVRSAVTVDGTGNELHAGFKAYAADGTYLGNVSNTVVDSAQVAADGWQQFTITVTSATILAAYSTAAYIRAYANGGRNSSGTASGTTWQLSTVRLQDTTSEAAAAGSASAAATSASNAATSASGAATSASAANTSATNAATSAGAASTSATNAANSATTASGHAATASTQATNAANSATAAAGSASAASGSASTASTQATNAGNSATAAQAAQVAAESARDAASGSASAAATSASSAATSATNAGTSASSASTSATNAATSAGAASTSATNASNSATTAAGHASTASTQATNAANSASAAAGSASAASGSASTASTQATNAGNSATAAAASAVSAQSVANRILPDRPATAADFVSSLTPGLPDSATPLSSGSVVTVSGEGDVRQFTTNVQVITRGWLPVVAGRTYRYTTRTRVTVDGTGNWLVAGFLAYASDGSYLGSVSYGAVDSSHVVADGWQNHTADVTTTTILAAFSTAAYIRAISYGGRNSSNTPSGATWQIASLSLRDVTSEAAAAASATAAATSASSASTSATNAGVSASSAATSATNAATSAGNASTSATNASNSATTAAGHASTASTQATNAANSASAAAGSASAAAGSASTASTQATNAGNSATAAASSAVSAQSVANKLMPRRPAIAADFVSASNAGAPDTATPISTGSVQSVAGEGDVRQFSGLQGVFTRGGFQPIAGHTYRLTARARVTADGTGNRIRMALWLFDSSWASLTTVGLNTMDSNFVVADGWQTFTIDVTTTQILAASASAANVRGWVISGENSGGTTSGSTWQLAILGVDDVTSELAAAGSASAAATSASSAATSATNAGVSASSAATSATNAATSAGNASTSETNASNSATTAAGHASTASTQATNAANSASAAAGSASAASGSASSASTSATNAANSATAAASSVVSAQSVANRIIPERVSNGADFATNVNAGSPDSATPLSAGTVVAVSGEGDVRQFTDGNTILVTRGALAVGSGRTFRVAHRTRVTVDGTANVAYSRFCVYDSSWTYLGDVAATTNDSSFVVADGWQTFTIETTSTAILAAYSTAAYVRGGMRGGRNASNSSSGATWQIAFLRFQDVTSEAAAAGSATAAATSASSASTSATNAANSASAASSSAVTASSAKDAANLTAAALWPSTFDQDGQFWTNSETGLANTGSSATGFATVSGIGRVYEKVGFATFCPKGLIPAIPNAVYEVEVKARVTVDSTVTGGTKETFVINQPRTLDATGASVSPTYLTGSAVGAYPQQKATFRVADGWTVFKTRFTIPASPSYVYLRPRCYMGYDAGGNGDATWQVAYFKITDVTNLVSAEGQASAAATSASSAATSATNAGSSASAASTSATNASTSAGSASTSATNASNSATAAAGSASAASTSATLSANYASASGASGLLFNSKFMLPLVSGVPTNWTNWSNGTGTAVSRNGNANVYAFRLAGGAGANAGCQQSAGANGVVQAGKNYYVRATTWLQSGTYNGAGLYIDWRDSSGTALTATTIGFANTANTNGVTANNHVGFSSWDVKVTAPANAVRATIYFMSHWSSQNGGNSVANSIDWYEVDFVPESYNSAGVNDVRTAVADASGAYSYYGMKVAAGNRFASIEALASTKTNISQLKMTADKFTVQTSSTDKQVFEVTGDTVRIDADLNVSAGITVGAARLKVALESIRKTGADGAAITWAGGTNIGNIPEYVLDLSSLAALSAGEQYSVYLTSVTGTGATVYAKIITPGTTSTVSQTVDAAGGGSDPDRVMAKSDSADAYDGIYYFRVVGSMQVTSLNEGGGIYSNDGSVIISTWFNDGGGWDEGPPIMIYPWDIGIDYITTYDAGGSHSFDITVPISWSNAIGAGSTYDFGVSLENPGSGQSLTDLHTVSYTKQSSSGTRTASPNGEVVKITAFPRNA